MTRPSNAPPPSPQVTIVRCPGCGGPSRYASDNTWRPFCSERCKRLDLGAWASESYRVPAEAPPDDGDGRPPPVDL